MAARLIVNADDFGLTPGINRAVVELYQAGAVTSATLMAAGPAFADAVDCARRHPGLGVGCHVVFVDGVPVSTPERVRSLLGRDGRRFRESVAAFVVAGVCGRMVRAELVLEAEAQIRRLQEAGIAVTHVDTHKHTHVSPAVAEAVMEAAARCGVRAVRNPFEPGWSARLARAGAGRRAQLGMAGRMRGRFERVAAEANAWVPDGTLGMAATGTLDGETLRAMLEALRSGHEGETYELCCHPGHVDEALEGARTRLRGSRAVEYGALLEVVPEMVGSVGGPALIHYGSAGAGSAGAGSAGVAGVCGKGELMWAAGREEDR